MRKITKEIMAAVKAGDRSALLRGETNPAAKLTPAKVREMRLLWYSEEMTLREIAQRFGVTTATVHGACVRRTWRHVR